MSNKELVELLNNLKITQTSTWNENIPEELWEKYFTTYILVADELDIDRRRWYELSTEVISINDGFIGVRSITNMYSEQSSFEDMYHTLEFFEMEKVPSFTYKKK